MVMTWEKVVVLVIAPHWYWTVYSIGTYVSGDLKNWKATSPTTVKYRPKKVLVMEHSHE